MKKGEHPPLHPLIGETEGSRRLSGGKKEGGDLAALLLPALGRPHVSSLGFGDETKDQLERREKERRSVNGGGRKKKEREKEKVVVGGGEGARVG